MDALPRRWGLIRVSAATSQPEERARAPLLPRSWGPAGEDPSGFSVGGAAKASFAQVEGGRQCFGLAAIDVEASNYRSARVAGCLSCLDNRKVPPPSCAPAPATPQALSTLRRRPGNQDCQKPKPWPPTSTKRVGEAEDPPLFSCDSEELDRRVARSPRRQRSRRRPSKVMSLASP